MGCLRLTYNTETTAPNWQVWTAESGEKETKEVIEAQSGGSQQHNPFPEVNQRTYNVRRGDNLYRIGLRNGISTQTLKKLNGLNGNKIVPGQRLIVETMTQANIRTFNKILNTRIDYEGSQITLTDTPLGNYLTDQLGYRLNGPYSDGTLDNINFIMYKPTVISPSDSWFNTNGTSQWMNSSWSWRARAFDKFCSDGCR